MQPLRLHLRRAVLLLVLFSLLTPIQPARSAPGDEGTIWFDHTSLTGQLGGYIYALTVGESERFVYFSRGSRLMIADRGADLGNIDAVYQGPPLNGTVLDIMLSGPYAYLAASEAGLVIIDVSNPASMRVVGTYDTPGDARGIWVQGSVVYLACGTDGIFILDAANPAQPALLGLNGLDSALDLVSDGSRLFVAADGKDLVVFTIASPGVLTNQVSLALEGVHYRRIAYGYYNTLVLASGADGYLAVVNTSSNGLTLGYNKRLNGSLSSLQDVYLDWDTVYTAGELEGFCSVTLADLADGTANARSCYTELGRTASRVVGLDGMMYGAYIDQLALIRAADMVKTDAYNLDLKASIDAATADGYIYTVDSKNLVIYDSANALKRVGKFDGPYIRVLPLTSGGHKYVVVAGSNNTITAINVDSPDTPQIVGSVTLSGTVVDWELAGTMLYAVLSISNELVTVDLSHLNLPVQCDSVSLGSTPAGLDLFTWITLPITTHRRAYVAMFDKGMLYVDAADPLNLKTPVTYSPGGYVYDIAVRGGGLLNSPSGVYLAEMNRIGVYNAANLNAGAQETLDEPADQLLIQNGTLFAGIGEEGVVLYDISTPLKPQKIGWAQIPARVYQLSPGGMNQVFAINPWSGIHAVLGLTEKTFIPAVLR